MRPRAVVIGSGFAGLSAATSLARKGHDTLLLEKNAQLGGRAQVYETKGFRFDMGPSWYWMPEVFEDYFNSFGHRVEDLYDLVRLDPSYMVIFDEQERWRIPAGMSDLEAFFESKEKGAAKALRKFLKEAKVKYDLGMSDLVYRPALSWSEFMRADVITGMMKTTVLRSLRTHVRSHFKHRGLQELLEFPVLFLGAAPQHTPALYSLMNHADMTLGTWYPMGGMGSVVNAMVNVAEQEGVTIRRNAPVEQVLVRDGHVEGVQVNGERVDADVIVAAADYHHVDQHLLAPEYRSYTAEYWAKRTMAPSSLLFYLGIDRKLEGLEHHTLFFDESLDAHSSEIYDEPQWPRKPLFYTSCASKTDPAVAPAGSENLVALIPIAPGLEDTQGIRERYFNIIMDRMRRYMGFDVREHIVVKRSYCINDLERDHNAYRGNAYGLANTLRQTAVLRPSMKSKKVKGLYFAGQLTVPGPGVPPAIISGQVVADLVEKEMQPLTA